MIPGGQSSSATEEWVPPTQHDSLSLSGCRSFSLCHVVTLFSHLSVDDSSVCGDSSLSELAMFSRFGFVCRTLFERRVPPPCLVGALSGELAWKFCPFCDALPPVKCLDTITSFSTASRYWRHICSSATKNTWSNKKYAFLWKAAIL